MNTEYTHVQRPGILDQEGLFPSKDIVETIKAKTPFFQLFFKNETGP